jgi:glutathione S-transferase
MRLYYAPGTISLMPHVALIESGRPFTAIRVDEVTKSLDGGGDFRSVNPLGYVPALSLDDGTLLLEAAAIAQFVADLEPMRKLAPPNGTVERAQLQAWLNFLSSELHKGGLGPLFYKDLPEAGKDVFRKRLAARFGRLDVWLSRNMYLMGDAFTIADAGLYAMTSWCPRVAFDVGQWPNVGAHHARVAERPSVQRVHEVAGDQSLHCLKSLKG